MKFSRVLAASAAVLLGAALSGCSSDASTLPLNPVPVPADQAFQPSTPEQPIPPEEDPAEPTPEPEPEPTEVVPEDVDVFSLSIGDCLLVPTDEGSSVSTSPLVDCSDPHEDEVFAIVEATLASHPGREAMMDHADEMCEPFFEDYVGISYWDSELFIWAYTPTVDGWAAGDREIICVASIYDGVLTDTIRDSRR